MSETSNFAKQYCFTWLSIALTHLVFGILLGIIIGIPWVKQHFKLVFLAARTPIPANALVFINIRLSDIFFSDFIGLSLNLLVFCMQKYPNLILKTVKAKIYLSICNPSEKPLSL
jgi:hypothetical protein